MSPPREPSTPQAALHALVIGLFSADEWRRWLRYGPDADLLPEVPEGGSLAELAERTLAALERRGRIDAAFFERLEAERPQRKAAVAAVAERWASSRGSTGPTGIRGPPVPPSSARQPTGAARIDVEGDFVAGSKTVHNHYHSAPPGVPAASAGPTAPATRTTAPTAEICRLGIQDIPSEGLVGASSRPGRGTHVITLEAPIAGIPSAIENTEVQAALALDREMTRRRIGLNDLDPGGGDPGTWSRGRERIREAVRSYLVETVCTSDARHVSIFGLAPIPWLMALGYAISETVPSRVFTRLREPASWTWEDDRPELSRWSAHRLGEGGGARRAVILISASAAVQRERVEQVLPASGCVTYEIRLSQPRLDAVRSEAQLDEFGRIYRGVLDDVERLDRDVEEIHLFVAAPVAIAVDCGRRILHSATPPVVTYNFTARGYVRALTLEP